VEGLRVFKALKGKGDRLDKLGLKVIQDSKELEGPNGLLRHPLQLGELEIRFWWGIFGLIHSITITFMNIVTLVGFGPGILYNLPEFSLSYLEFLAPRREWTPSY
jgi:hypothetical protein